jgi:hypothetical protein
MKGRIKGKGKQGSIIKYVLILVIGVIGGNIASKYTGMQEFITKEI